MDYPCFHLGLGLLRRPLWLFCIVLGLSVSASVAYAQPAANPAAPANTTILVDRSDDPEPSSLTRTCGFDDSIYSSASDGCTLRRALLEAGARPDSDRPIAIQFNLASDDPGYEADSDTWTITIDAPLLLANGTLDNTNVGDVTIDGATQPGGRSTGPKIYLETNDNRWDVELTDNVIRNLGFVGGGVIFLKETDNLIEDIVMGLSRDGQEIVLRTPDDPKRLAGGGVHISADDNTVRDSVISGSFASAITIDGSDNNLIELNYIGTRADGTVPPVDPAIECLRSFNYDPNNWYGGWGINLSGSNNIIAENLIAGLHILQSPNDTPPRALEIFGSNHLIVDNEIGLGSDGEIVGVCGQGIKVSGSDTEILFNVIAASRADSEEAEPAAILASDTSPLFGQITVAGNEVILGPGTVYGFGPGIKDDLRLFNPAKVTSVTSTTVSGRSGDTTPNTNGPDVESACPNCLIDLYLDDLDDNQEALLHLGGTTADGDGNWSFSLSEPLPADAAIRTNSTTTSAGVIGSYGAGTSTKLSELYFAPTGVMIEGPTTGEVGVEYEFDITTEPLIDEDLYSYTVTVTDRTEPLTGQLGSFANLRFTWQTPGVKMIDVMVETALGMVSATHTISITGDSNPTPTPSPTPEPTPSPSSAEGVFLPIVRR
jgi:hypothetical protein